VDRLKKYIEKTSNNDDMFEWTPDRFNPLGWKY
jgi:hypothetical protein